MATATTVRVPCTTIGNISHCQILPFHDYEASSELAQYILDAQRKLIGNIFCRIGPEGERRLKILAMERVDLWVDAGAVEVGPPMFLMTLVILPFARTT